MIDLLIARIFFPETFPVLPFNGARKCGVLVTIIAGSVLLAWSLSS